MKSTVKILMSSLLLLCLLSGESAGIKPASAQGAPPVLAFYYAWFDHNTWSSGQATDAPVEPYHSADRATIERHVSQAQAAGIDAFVQSWYGPSENPTETNFRTLLDVAQAAGLRASVDFEVTSPFYGDSGAVTSALVTLLNTHAQHPAYFRYQGKPVIFFWRQQRFSVDAWAAIRNQVDPNRSSIWVAEGTDIGYQAVFDAHHLYSIAWAGSPADQLLKWGNQVRSYEANHQVDRLWVATVMPGYNDTRLPRANAFAVARRDGNYYRETWHGALASQPDMLILTSFNEWLEGTQIEPSVSYGNLYLDVTRDLVTQMRGSPPPVPIPAAAVQEATPTLAAPTPTGPYIRVPALTNVRSGPGITYSQIGQLPAGSLVPVLGQAEGGAWWQIEFENSIGWVSGEVVEFGGDAAAVPVVEAPTPTIAVTPALTGTVEAEEAAPAATGEPGEDSSQAEGASTPQATPTPAEPPTPTATVIAGTIRVEEPINVRAEPSLESTLIGGLYQGDTAEVLAISEDGEWWQIEFLDGPDSVGWVAAEFVTFQGDRAAVAIFGIGTATPTPGPTDTPTPAPSETPTAQAWPTFAPTATSVYQGTAAALLEQRGTPDPSLQEGLRRPSRFEWDNFPWGIISIMAVIAFLWYQFYLRRRY